MPVFVEVIPSLAMQNFMPISPVVCLISLDITSASIHLDEENVIFALLE